MLPVGRINFACMSNYLKILCVGRINFSCMLVELILSVALGRINFAFRSN